MATNLNLDNELIDAAVKLGQHPTKRAAVNAALSEYVQRHRQMDLLNLAGRIEWEAGYDYKAERRRPRASVARRRS